MQLILLSIYSICQYQWIGLNFHVGSSHVITESSELLNALGEISWLLKLVCVLTLIYWSHHFQLTHLTTVNLQSIKSDIPTQRLQSDCYFDSERRRTIKREGAEWICASSRPVVDRLISVSHSFSFFLLLSSQTTHLGKKNRDRCFLCGVSVRLNPRRGCYLNDPPSSVHIYCLLSLGLRWAPQFVVSCFLERNGCNAVLVPEIGYTGCTCQRFHIHESVCSLINDANLPVQPPGVFKWGAFHPGSLNKKAILPVTLFH